MDRWQGTLSARRVLLFSPVNMAHTIHLRYAARVLQVVSGKYVMIVDVIVTEQEGLNTVLMVREE